MCLKRLGTNLKPKTHCIFPFSKLAEQLAGAEGISNSVRRHVDVFTRQTELV